MSVLERAETHLVNVIDRLFGRVRQPVPTPDRLAGCRIVAHRGAHGCGCPENTPAAFARALAAGVWGIEFDVRWTRDRVPVVLHDSSPARVFGVDVPVGRTTAHELRRRCPQVPTLAEVLEQCGRRAHLMIEIKDELPASDPRLPILAGHLAGFAPVRDYHLLSLAPRMFAALSFAPPAAFVPVARVNVAEFSRAALLRGWGGVAGHYALTAGRVIGRHHAAGQAVGTGYVRSLSVLYREVNRGVDWIFSNHAAELRSALGLSALSVRPG